MNINNLTNVDWEIIHGMAECNLNASETARKLFMHRQTVDYHVLRILDKTGLDARKFYDMMQLLNGVFVVRCQNCIHHLYDEQFNQHWCVLHCGSRKVTGDDFCSYGKPR